MNTQTVRLDLGKDATARRPVLLGQGDHNGTTIRAELYDAGTELSTSGLTAFFVMRLPDGEHYYRKQASLAGNVATVTVDEQQAASAPGTTRHAYFQLLRGEEVIASTSRFNVRVLRGALDGATPGETYDSAIDEALAQISSAVSDADASAGKADAAATGANEAAEAAANAANDATAAAEQARGAVSAGPRFTIAAREFHDGTNRIALVDAGEE